jgi:hypothetical protein
MNNIRSARRDKACSDLNRFNQAMNGKSKRN